MYAIVDRYSGKVLATYNERSEAYELVSATLEELQNKLFNSWDAFRNNLITSKQANTITIITGHAIENTKYHNDLGLIVIVPNHGPPQQVDGWYYCGCGMNH